MCAATGATRKHVEATRELVREFVARAGEAESEEALALGNVEEWARMAVARLTCAEAGKQEL